MKILFDEELHNIPMQSINMKSVIFWLISTDIWTNQTNVSFYIRDPIYAESIWLLGNLVINIIRVTIFKLLAIFVETSIRLANDAGASWVQPLRNQFNPLPPLRRG